MRHYEYDLSSADRPHTYLRGYEKARRGAVEGRERHTHTLWVELAGHTCRHVTAGGTQMMYGRTGEVLSAAYIYGGS